MHAKNRNPKESVIIIIALFILFYLKSGSNHVLWFSLIFSFLGLVSIRFTLIVQRILNQFTFIIGQTVQIVTLTLVFFILLTPLAFLSRIFGEKDVMMLKNNYKSTFLVSKENFNKSYFEKMW